MEIHTPSLCYLLEVFFPYLHRVFPAVAQIDGMGSSHCPFADEVTVIDIAVLVDTVHHNHPNEAALPSRRQNRTLSEFGFVFSEVERFRSDGYFGCSRSPTQKPTAALRWAFALVSGESSDYLLNLSEVLSHELVGDLVVLEVAGEVLVVGRHVDEAVSAEIEEQHLLLAGLLA